VQSEFFFEFNAETKFLQYKENANIDDQGEKVRLNFTDTVKEAKLKIQEAFRIEPGNYFDLIEVSRTKNGFCQVSNPMSLMDDSHTLSDAKVTHLSTWMIVMD
jgi:hypothetical protein